MQRTLKTLIPFLILSILIGLLYRSLFSPTIHTRSSPLIGVPLPALSLPDLIQPNRTLNEKVFLGHVSLLNIWATWCEACLHEHSLLMKIDRDFHIPIYSIVYKDNPLSTKNWLSTYGNPYTMVGVDPEGEAAIDFGIYGTPETFVIDKKGIIVYRHVGALDENSWANTIAPLIAQLEREQ